MRDEIFIYRERLQNGRRMVGDELEYDKTQHVQESH